MTYLLQLLFYIDSDDEKFNNSNKSMKYAGWSPSPKKFKSKFLLVTYYNK